jgi:hypothetical protein
MTDNDRPEIDWDRVSPEVAALLRPLYEAGYGQWTVSQKDPDGPIVVLHSITQAEMEAMGAEERARLGLEKDYQYGLNPIPPDPPNKVQK